MSSIALSNVLVVSVRATSVTIENIDEKLRLLNPVFMMIEGLFRLENRNNCLEKMFCLLETSRGHSKTSNPLHNYSQVLTNARRDIDPEAFEKVKDLISRYQGVSKVVHAITIGQRSLNSNACHFTYSQCAMMENDVIELANMLSDGNALSFTTSSRGHTGHPAKRKTCDATGQTCGLVGGGCALCTTATEGPCGPWCLPEVGSTCSGLPSAVLLIACWININTSVIEQNS